MGVPGLCETGPMDVANALTQFQILTLLAIGGFFLYLSGVHRGRNKGAREETAS